LPRIGCAPTGRLTRVIAAGGSTGRWLSRVGRCSARDGGSTEGTLGTASTGGQNGQTDNRYCDYSKTHTHGLPPDFLCQGLRQGPVRLMPDRMIR
jgi:hypothetical protein